MRLLMIGPELRSLDDVSNYSGVWSYYLRREFLRGGIELEFCPRPPTGQEEAVFAELPEGFDHALALGSRYLSRMVAPDEALRVLRTKVLGFITQLNDGALMPAPNIDFTFTARDDRGRFPGMDTRFNVLVGWAADERQIKPEQSREELRILVDHPYYGSAKRPGDDLTASVLQDAIKFAQGGLWRNTYRRVRVRQIVDRGFADVALEGSYPVKAFHREHVSFPQACEEYGRAHVFLVTHKESLGLTVLETAMAGALPIVPTGFIPSDRLATIRCVEYRGQVPWLGVLGLIDPGATRAAAMCNDWPSVAGKIEATLVGGTL